MEGEFSIINKTKGKLPSLPFVFIKADILGKNYSLSLAFVGEKISQRLNNEYRGKNNPTNILSFGLSKTEGEIIICLPVVRREVKDDNKNRGKNFPEYLLFLVIHGMLHLKGMEHSSKMDRAEELYCKKYDQKHFSRNRPRLDHNTSSSGRVFKRRKKS